MLASQSIAYPKAPLGFVSIGRANVRDPRSTTQNGRFDVWQAVRAAVVVVVEVVCVSGVGVVEVVCVQR